MLAKLWDSIGFKSWTEFAMFVGVLASIALILETMAQSL
jgi:hypothetical protein